MLHKSAPSPLATIRPREISTTRAASTIEGWGPASKSSMLSRASAIKELAHELEKDIATFRPENEAPRTSRTASLSPNPSQCVCGNGSDSSNNWMRSLQLFHFYCTSTCLTLHFGESTMELWRTSVPRTALAHVSHGPVPDEHRYQN